MSSAVLMVGASADGRVDERNGERGADDGCELAERDRVGGDVDCECTSIVGGGVGGRCRLGLAVTDLQFVKYVSEI